MNATFRLILRRLGHWSVAAFVASCAFFLAALSRGATPMAGSAIGNQASATYTDSSSTPHTATSNIVLTVIQQVGSVSLASDRSNPVSPGGQVIFPHTLTNTGNGSDTFALTMTQLSGDNFDLTNVSIYADVNGDGLPDNSTAIITTGAIAPGARFNVVVVGTVPGGQTSTQNAKIRITATSAFDAAQNAANTDTATVTGNAVVQTTFSVNPTGGASPSGPYTYTLTFTNTGNVTATDVTLTDILPAGLTYVGGSARWSASGTTALNDATGGDPAGIAYDYGVTQAGRITAVLASLSAGQSGTLTFQANIAAGVSPGPIPNTANYTFNDGSNVVGPFATNTAILTVTSRPAVTMAGETVAAAAQGSTVKFTNVVTNTGSGSETFEITLAGSTFPTGTLLHLVKADGSSPLLDSNNNGTFDTGPLAAGATYTIILRATLPPSATGGSYTVNKVATAASDPTVSASAADTLTAVTASTVDLTGNVAGTAGAGAGPEGSSVIDLPGNPGSTVRFTLNVKNGNAGADTFDLDSSSVQGFGTLGLPPGWSVVYRNAAGVVVSKTDLLVAGGSQLIYADVTIPSGQTPIVQDVFFRVRSAVTGASDRLHDSVTVSAARQLIISPNNSGQIYPNSTVVYSHTLTNLGNVLEGDALVSTAALTATNNLPGWNSVIYYDANGNGVIDLAEPIVTDLTFVSNGAAGISPGESIKLLVKVFAPASATAGAAGTTTLSIATINGTHTSSAPSTMSATDTTTVVLAELRLLKEQAIDANNDGVADTGYSINTITTGAASGVCVRYRVTVTNTGSEPALTVVVNDATPTFTTYHATIPAATSAGSVISTPTAGTAGPLSFNVGTLAPGESVIITFGVKID